MGEGSAQFWRTLWEKSPVFCCWVPFFFPTELTWFVFRPSLVSFLAMSWTNKNKAEIFEHLEEIGISRSAARELLRTPPEKEPTKKGGLLLIKAAVRSISGASLMSSPWAEVVQAVLANFQLDLPEEEQHGLRASLMTRWTAFSLEAIVAEELTKSGLNARALVLEEELNLGEDLSLMPVPPANPPDVPPATQDTVALERVLLERIDHEDQGIAGIQASLDLSRSASLELEKVLSVRREEEATKAAREHAWIAELQRRADERSALAVSLRAEFEKAEAYRTRLVAEATAGKTPSQQVRPSVFPSILQRQPTANVSFAGLEDHASKRLRGGEERLLGSNEHLLLAALGGGRKTPETANTRTDGLTSFCLPFPLPYIHVGTLMWV